MALTYRTQVTATVTDSTQQVNLQQQATVTDSTSVLQPLPLNFVEESYRLPGMYSGWAQAGYSGYTGISGYSGYSGVWELVEDGDIQQVRDATIILTSTATTDGIAMYIGAATPDMTTPPTLVLREIFASTMVLPVGNKIYLMNLNQPSGVSPLVGTTATLLTVLGGIADD